jgi:hypothetical protein
MKTLLVLGTALITFLLGVASAGTLQLTGIDDIRGGVLDFKANGEDISQYAGVFLANYNGKSVSPILCVDFFLPMGYDPNVTTVSGVNTTRHEDRAAWLFHNYIDAIDNNLAGRAIQLAIWDIVHDNGDGLAHGSIQQSVWTNGYVAELTNYFISSSEGQSDLSATIYHNISTETGKQAQSMIGLVDTPEPGTMALGALGGTVLWLSRRRNKKVAE